MKTNAARLLDRLGITYEILDYVFDPELMSAEHVAQQIGMPAGQVFKTLLCHLHGGEHVFAVVPGNAELDLKKLALAAGAKKADLAALKEVEPLTGYLRGGVTAMAAKKTLRTFADESMQLFPQISVSAGLRGKQLLLAPADYLRAAAAVGADLKRAAGE